MAVGDVRLDDTEPAGVDAFARVRPALGEADLAVVNLETAVADASTGAPEAKTFVFRTPPSGARTLANAGVDVASVANNHSLDFGPAAFLSGLDIVRSAGVATVGGGPNITAAMAPVERVVGGVRVAVVAASRVIPHRSWTATATTPGLAQAYDVKSFVGQVQRAKANADVVIAMVHWGAEGATCPQPEIVQLGTALIRAGATAVIGSHPHVLQPIVRSGTGLIAYSLGNFAFGRHSGRTGDTAVLELGFNGAELTSVTTHPHLLHHGPPRPADAESAARIRAALDPSGCPGLLG